MQPRPMPAGGRNGLRQDGAGAGVSILHRFIARAGDSARAPDPQLAGGNAAFPAGGRQSAARAHDPWAEALRPAGSGRVHHALPAFARMEERAADAAFSLGHLRRNPGASPRGDGKVLRRVAAVGKLRARYRAIRHADLQPRRRNLERHQHSRLPLLRRLGVVFARMVQRLRQSACAETRFARRVPAAGGADAPPDEAGGAARAAAEAPLGAGAGLERQGIRPADGARDARRAALETGRPAFGAGAGNAGGIHQPARAAGHGRGESAVCVPICARAAGRRRKSAAVCTPPSGDGHLQAGIEGVFAGVHHREGDDTGEDERG